MCLLKYQGWIKGKHLKWAELLGERSDTCVRGYQFMVHFNPQD